jgi:hypothetical protein
MKETTGYLILLTILMIPVIGIYNTVGLLGLALVIGIFVVLIVLMTLAFNLIQSD